MTLPAVSEIPAKVMAPPTIDPRSTPRKRSLSNHEAVPPRTNSPHKPVNNVEGHTNPFANWHNYTMNKSTIVTAPNPIPSPPPSVTSNTPRSSTSSSPSEPLTIPQPNFQKPRSRSLAMPAPTTPCPKCGLRRPSDTSSPISPGITVAMPIKMTTKYSFSRPHLPLHLHNPDCCPDEHLPHPSQFTPPSPTGAGMMPFARNHHRRRSSLCYSESLAADTDVLDSGSFRDDGKRQSSDVARKIVYRQTSGDGNADVFDDFKGVEEAIADSE